MLLAARCSKDFDQGLWRRRRPEPLRSLLIPLARPLARPLAPRSSARRSAARSQIFALLRSQLAARCSHQRTLTKDYGGGDDPSPPALRWSRSLGRTQSARLLALARTPLARLRYMCCIITLGLCTTDLPISSARLTSVIYIIRPQPDCILIFGRIRSRRRRSHTSLLSV